jgi:hypothetical protein
VTVARATLTKVAHAALTTVALVRAAISSVDGVKGRGAEQVARRPGASNQAFAASKGQAAR